MSDRNPAEQIILAIDTSNKVNAAELVSIATNAGARLVKMGLELSSATSWAYCSSLAADFGLDWVADAKLNDIPNTVERTVDNIVSLPHPPFGITMHTLSGPEAMLRAQRRAETVKMLGVTVLTSFDEYTSMEYFRSKVSDQVHFLAYKAADAGLAGLVCSPLEVKMIKDDEYTTGLFTMIPGARSIGANVQDQARVTTPAEAIRNGANLLVIGRQVTGATDPVGAFQAVVEEISLAQQS